jgi:hypothetical protein
MGSVWAVKSTEISEENKGITVLSRVLSRRMEIENT